MLGGRAREPCRRPSRAWHGRRARAKRAPVRIALFCPSYGQVGGIEEKARVLIGAFRACGHAVTVLARGEPGTSSRDGDVPVVRSEYHQMPRRARHGAAVGVVVPQKGFAVLLGAFAGLDAPEVDLLIAGDGPERRRLEALRERLGLGARVHLLGAMDRATVASLYRGARLVACPSRWEGLPLVCLEAMASGRAVVASRVDGIPDAVSDGETGLLVAPEDPVALAAALRALLEDAPRRDRLGARGRALVCAELTRPSAAERYLAVLADAAAPR